MNAHSTLATTATHTVPFRQIFASPACQMRQTRQRGNTMAHLTGRTFVGSRDETLSFLRSRPGHYVYILRRADGTPFYVGKGIGYRVLQHETESRLTRRDHKLNTLRQMAANGEQVLYEIDSVFRTHGEAIRREIALIAAIGRVRDGGTLTNLTAGGEGIVDVSPEVKERHRRSLGGIPDYDPERAAINGFFLRFGAPKSICVKAARGFRIEPTVIYSDRPGRSPTPRMAIAIAVAAAACGQRIAAATPLPRAFTIDGIPVVIENGVARDIATSGLATVVANGTPWNETFLLDARYHDFVRNQISPSVLAEFRID